jgi:hypothetical protein
MTPSPSPPALLEPPAPSSREAPFLLGAAKLAETANVQQTWLWEGFLAPGVVTLLVSQWKCGKSTLMGVLLAHLKNGGTLAGLPVQAGRAVVVSEESNEIWNGRAAKLAYGDHLGWFIRPFLGRPRKEDWDRHLDRLMDLHAGWKYDLLLIDPLAHYLSGSENHAASVIDFLMMFQRLSALGISVLLLHHPSKGKTLPGQAARGSGALAGYVDIHIEKNFVRRRERSDRRRRLAAYSRFSQTPQELVIELNAEETDYRVLGSLSEAELHGSWNQLEAALADAPKKLTRQQIAERWTGSQRPEPKTLVRWLEEAVRQNLLRKDGEGFRKHPFRYWLPAREAFWRNDINSCIDMPEFFQQTREPLPTSLDPNSGDTISKSQS